MEYVIAVVLGFVQGLTEFLPVSSTGHLILTRAFFGISDTNALAFDALLHLATAGAVIVYFHRDLWILLQTFLRYIGRMPVNRRDRALVAALIVGTIPAVIAGLLLEAAMETLFRNPLLVAVVLVLGSFLFIVAERLYQKVPRTRDITVRTGMYVGLFQVLALIPGMSRSGATISGGMILGLSRSDATRFAFLLAVPIILGAGAKKFLGMITGAGDVSWFLVGSGALTAFLVGIFAVHFLVTFLRTHTLWVFIWYRIALASVVMLAIYFG